MSRSMYVDDGWGGQEEQWATIRWRGAVTSAIRGKRGQAFLRELRDALDAMEDKRLIAGHLQIDGQHCALGCVAAARDIDTAPIEFPEDEWDCEEHHFDRVADVLGIASALAREIMFMNDEAYEWLHYGAHGPKDEPSRVRWRCVRRWVEEQIRDS